MHHLIMTDTGVIEKRVINIQPDKDIYELDYSFWLLIKQLAAEIPENVMSVFSFTQKEVDMLIEVNEKMIARLSSGIVLSFILKTQEEHFFKVLDKFSKNNRVSTISLNENADFCNLEVAYWLLVKRIAAKDHIAAGVVFGITPELALAVSSVTDNQLREMAQSTASAFNLRFDKQILFSLLMNEKPEELWLRKYQQSLMNSRFLGKNHE